MGIQILLPINEFSMHSIEDLGLYLHIGGTNAGKLEESFLDLLLFNNLNMPGVKIFAVTTDTTANMNACNKKLENN